MAKSIGKKPAEWQLMGRLAEQQKSRSATAEQTRLQAEEEDVNGLGRDELTDIRRDDEEGATPGEIRDFWGRMGSAPLQMWPRL